MKRTKRKITTLFMSLMLVLSLVAPMMPAMSMKVYAAAEEWNTDQNFETDVTVDGGVIIRRNITLTIAEGVTVTVNGGIDTNSTVTIKGKGHLIVNGSKGNDGVDLGYWESVDDPDKEAGNGCTGGTGFNGKMVVDGASVTITGGQGGKGGDSDSWDHNAGQGGAGGFGVYGNITVNNGALTVTGGSGGKGGAGDLAEMISGAGGEGGCGINGIVRANGGSININGGKGGTGGKGVCDHSSSGAWGNPGADGGNGGSGIIGGPVYANGGMITVHGGDGGVGGQGSSGKDGDDYYNMGGGGPGMGGGKGGNGGEGVSGAITVNGGEIATYGGEGGPGGEGGYGGNSIGDNQGGSGGSGGNGGQGGIGASQDVVVDSGSLTASGGPGGEGGYGGLGGTGNVKGIWGGGGTDGTYGKAVGGSISGGLSEESVDNSTWTKITGSASTAQYVSVTGSGIIVARYSVVFDENGKTATDMPAAQRVKEGDKATAPEKKPKADGFVFGGWYTEDECKTKYDFSATVSEDITLYAKWFAEGDYDVWVGGTRVSSDNMESIPCDSGKASYNPDTKTLNLDDAIISKTGEDGYIIKALGDLTIVGTGTLVNEDATAAIAIPIFSGDVVLKLDADLDITAKTAGITAFTGELQIDGGDITVRTSGDEAIGGIVVPKLVISGGNVEIDSKIQGIYVVDGIEITGGTVVASGSEAAMLTAEDADIAIDSTLKITNPASAEVGKATIEETVYKTIVDGDGKVAKAVSIEPAVKYTVTFDANGKTATDMPAALTVKEGEKATAPDKTPKAEGFIFGGWYTSADCKDEEAYDFTKAVTGGVTLYAKWTGVERTVTFDANGKTATEMPEAQKVENGKTATIPDKEPAAEGFKFAGWYTSKECKDEEAYDFTKAVTGDITLYAKWEEASAATFTVTFDLNGVSGNAPEAQTVEEGKTVSKPEDPKAEGFLFKTWCTDNAGEKEYDFTAPVSANFTLYAKWEKAEEDGPNPGPVVIGKSSLDPVPELVPGKTKDLYLVKGQKFNIAQGWYIDKADKESKRKVSINSKTGVFKAKSEGEAVIKSGFGDTEWEVNVHISKPKMGKTLKLQLETDTEVKSEQLQFEYDKNLKVLWYSANPDVVTVDNTGKVTTVGKGTSKVTAYINGSAYSCMVKVMEKEPLLNRTLHVAKGSSKSISIKGLKNAEWEDSVKDIVSVQNNKVKGLNAGTTELSVSQNGKAYKVNLIVEDLTMKGTGLRTQGKTGSNKYIIDELKANGKTKLSFEGVTQPVVFKSSKPEVAVIDENLNVEIRGRGRTKFTAKVNGKTVTITVNAK